MKAIAMHTAILVILIALFFGFAILLFFRYVTTTTTQANSFFCSLKKWNYCVEWTKTEYDPSKKPYDWNKQGPLGCEKEGIEISEPQGREDCGIK